MIPRHGLGRHGVGRWKNNYSEWHFLNEKINATAPKELMRRFSSKYKDLRLTKREAFIEALELWIKERKQ